MAIKMKSSVTLTAKADCPSLGISCFVIKSTLNDPNISLKDVFLGSLPFAFLMLLVLIVIIQYPILSTALL